MSALVFLRLRAETKNCTYLNMLKGSSFGSMPGNKPKEACVVFEHNQVLRGTEKYT